MSQQNELKLAKKQFEEATELEAVGKYKEAVQLFKQASSLYEKWEQWEEWIKANMRIGAIHSVRMRDKNGITHLLQVLEKGKKYLGEEHPIVGNCLRSIGVYYNVFGKYELAFGYFQDALAIQRKKLGEHHPDVANSLNGIGIYYLFNTGDYNLAIDYLKNALEICKENFGENHFKLVPMLMNLGICYFYKSNYTLALDYHQKALAILRENIGEEHLEIASILNNIGICHSKKGDHDLAIQYHQEALAMSKKISREENFEVSESVLNLGDCYSLKGDYTLAIDYYQETLRIQRKILGEEHPYVTRCLRNLGESYYLKENYELAIDYLQKSLNIYKKTLGEKHHTGAGSLRTIGKCYSVQKKHDLAISFYKEALAIDREKLGEKSIKVARNLYFIARDYLTKENYHLAIAYYQDALMAAIPSFNQKDIFQNPTLQEYSRGDMFLDILYGKTKTLLHFYKQQPQNIKHLQAALSTITLATDLVSDIRQSYKTEGAKYDLAEKSAKVYHQAIDIAIKTSNAYQQLSQIPQPLGFTNIPYTAERAKKLAFDFAEQSKAVLLLSNLKDNEAKVSSNIPTALLEKEQSLKIELNYLDKSIQTQEGKGAEKNEELLTKFQRQYFKYKREYDALIEQFEKEYPEYYQLKYAVSTASVQDLQSYLLDSSQKVSDTFLNDKKQGSNLLKSKVETLEVSDTSAIILSYHISEEKIYIFSISSNDYQITTVEKPSNFSQLIEKLQEDIQLGYVKEFIVSATKLFDVLLRPVWSSPEVSPSNPRGFGASRDRSGQALQSISKLIIIPHGELYRIPFDVLLNQHQITDTKNFTNLPYLIRDFDISYHYSATLLLHSHQRQLQTGKQVDSFFGLAPVHFGEKNSSEVKEGYVVKSSGKETERGRRILKSSGNVQAALEDLEETELEVKEVYQLFEEQGKEAIALFYDQANKQNLKEHIGGYKYVLISTHGFLQESGKNTLSGIHLAPVRGQESGDRSEGSGDRSQEIGNDIGEKAKRKMKEGAIQPFNNLAIEDNDYLLHTSETYHLNLNADLVVLSSCESGVGELKVGEGMMALNRGFLYAGASNIVYSLFQVPQDSTSQLTQALFRYILEGNSYSTALRKAKLELIGDDMMEPMDWAGFALVGG